MNYTAVHAATLVGLLYYCGTSDIIINGLCSNSCLYQLSTVSCIFSQYTSKKFYHCEFVVCDLPDQLSPMAVSVIILVGTQLVHAVYVHSRLQQTSEIQGGGWHQIKRRHFTVLLATNECIYRILWFLAHINYIQQQMAWCQFYLNECVTH